MSTACQSMHVVCSGSAYYTYRCAITIALHAALKKQMSRLAGEKKKEAR